MKILHDCLVICNFGSFCLEMTIFFCVPGTGYAQALGCGYILSYYVSIVALCLYYLAMSFQAELPWGVCAEEWDNCVPSVVTAEDMDINENSTSSAELYFVKTVLQQRDGVEGGLGK
uniref:Sodium-dependent nutrient amino acid transporter 1 n=1 Tax=Pectinophora gossypiella TaxID=13191 RepID=A0A1E1WJT3_PECGO